jgi:hypothetical protein
MPFPCHATIIPFWKRPLKVTAGSWQGRGRVTEWEQRGNGMLETCQRSTSFCYHAEFPESLLSEACQSQMQVVSVKQTTVVMDEEKLII